MQNDSNSANSQTHHNQSLRSRGIILAQMISQTMWRLSESIFIQWEPKYFNETVNEVLESIDSNKFQDAKGIYFIFHYFCSRIFKESKLHIECDFFREVEENVESITCRGKGS